MNEEDEETPGWKTGQGVARCETCFREKMGNEVNERKFVAGKKKNSGRRSAWSPEDDYNFIDIVVSNTYYKRKRIFPDTKCQRDSEIYEEILTELKKRAFARVVRTRDSCQRDKAIEPSSLEERKKQDLRHRRNVFVFPGLVRGH
ncbi:hypothetical protein P5673_011853 [Acropora cervicornis]|uniref:Uncharacterized protein n=1 Tax=Acropora cervicornis TaxID=6130 RepID=A0AAD9V7T0_ACRCE|nr:hypothetical protein P5673_011853 [Acropora cervicornis]